MTRTSPIFPATERWLPSRSAEDTALSISHCPTWSIPGSRRWASSRKQLSVAHRSSWQRQGLDLARKDGGIILLPPYSDETDAPYTSRLEALKGITGFLNHRKEDYVVISDCDGVARLDVADIVRSHAANQADITMVYTETNDIESSYYITLDPDETGRIQGVRSAPSSAARPISTST